MEQVDWSLIQNLKKTHTHKAPQEATADKFLNNFYDNGGTTLKNNFDYILSVVNFYVTLNGVLLVVRQK